MTIFLGGKIAKYCSQLLREATKLPFKTSEPQPPEAWNLWGQQCAKTPRF